MTVVAATFTVTLVPSDRVMVTLAGVVVVAFASAVMVPDTWKMSLAASRTAGLAPAAERNFASARMPGSKAARVEAAWSRVMTVLAVTARVTSAPPLSGVMVTVVLVVALI